MKIQVDESKYQTSLTINPENMAEFAKLLRMVKHSKREVPDMFLSFSENNSAPYLSISFGKKSAQNQITYLNNKKD